MNLPTVILPGYLEGAKAYQPLQSSLIKLGFPTYIVPIKQTDWLPTLGGRSMIPILRLLDRTVKEAQLAHSDSKINLIGHSAGGWISRIYLGEKPYTIHGDVDDSAGLWDAKSRIANLITLGTPHISGEKWTLKNLNFVNDNYPGAFYPEINYICVAGKSIYGEKKLGSYLAYSSYQLTCGNGNSWGDGITPISAAYLAGAKNITIEGIKHSPRSKLWYGSAQIISQWIIE